MQRGERQQADEQIDETLERLRELARRQEQEAERQQRLANRSQGAAGGGAQNQRSLADEVEEEARRLEELSRMQSNQRLAETARQLQDAANAMREAAAARGGEAAADARSALDRLRAARRLLERDQSGRIERDAQDALQRSEELIEEQLDVAEESVDISGADNVTAERMRRLIERKNEMSTEVADLERQIDEMSAEAGSEQQQAAESFDDALRNIRDNKIRERIQYSRGLPGARSPDFTRDFEQQTTEHPHGAARPAPAGVGGDRRAGGRPHHGVTRPGPGHGAQHGVAQSAAAGARRRERAAGAGPAARRASRGTAG